MFLEVSQNSHENTYARVSFSIKSIEAVVQRCSVEKVFLEILQNLQEITCVRVSILMMLQAWACNFIKKETLAQMFSCEFCEISKKTLFTEISGRLLLCFMTFSDWEFLPQRFKNICCCKIDCGKHYRLSKDFIKFPKTPRGTAKAIATFKETGNCKIPHAARAIWAPGTDFS